MPTCIPHSTGGGPCDEAKGNGFFKTWWTNDRKRHNRYFQLQWHRSENFMPGLSSYLRSSAEHSRTENQGDVNVDAYRIILRFPSYEKASATAAPSPSLSPSPAHLPSLSPAAAGRTILHYPCVASAKSMTEIKKDFDDLVARLVPLCKQAEDEGKDVWTVINPFCIENTMAHIRWAEEARHKHCTEAQLIKQFFDKLRTLSAITHVPTLRRNIGNYNLKARNGNLKSVILDHRSTDAILLQLAKTRLEYEQAVHLGILSLELPPVAEQRPSAANANLPHSRAAQSAATVAAVAAPVPAEGKARSDPESLPAPDLQLDRTADSHHHASSSKVPTSNSSSSAPSSAASEIFSCASNSDSDSTPSNSPPHPPPAPAPPSAAEFHLSRHDSGSSGLLPLSDQLLEQRDHLRPVCFTAKERATLDGVGLMLQNIETSNDPSFQAAMNKRAKSIHGDGEEFEQDE